MYRAAELDALVGKRSSAHPARAPAPKHLTVYGCLCYKQASATFNTQHRKLNGWTAFRQDRPGDRGNIGHRIEASVKLAAMCATLAARGARRGIVRGAVAAVRNALARMRSR